MMKRFLIVLAVVACTKAPEAVVEEPRAPVTVGQSRYVLDEGPYGPETTIVTTITAKDTTVFLENCNGAFPVGLQRLDGSNWVDAWAAEMNACLSPSIAVAPGESRTTTMTVASGVDAAVDSRRTPTKVGAGTYRAVWYAAKDAPLEQRVSAPFVIEVATPDASRASPRERPAEIVSIEPAHAARAALRDPIRVRFARDAQLAEPARIYVDREDVSERAKTSMEDVVFAPRGRWLPGRHNVRVVYRDRRGRTLWYAWYFMASEETL